MTPGYESKSIDQALAHLIEELGEATAAAGKCARWGFHSVNPTLPAEEQETNEDWLRREIDDVRHAYETLGKFLGY